MGKKHLKILKMKKLILTAIKLLFLGDVDNEKVPISNKIFYLKKTINTLLVTCIM